MRQVSTQFEVIQSDKDLVDRVLKGDKPAFEKIILSTERLVAQVV